MRKNIYVLEASILGADYIAKGIEKLGYEPIFMTNVRSQEGDALRQLLSNHYVECDTTNSQAIVDTIKLFGDDNAAAVFTYLDSRLLITAEVCQMLNVPGVPKGVFQLKNKQYVNDLLPDYVPLSFEIDTDNLDIKEIKSFFARTNQLVIAKPCFATGARGFYQVSSVKDLLDQLSFYQKQVPDNLYPSKYILQEYCQGELVSFEGYVINSEVVMMGVTSRNKVDHTESTGFFPYQSKIEPEVYDRCVAGIKTLISKSQYADGAFHIEFIINKGNCWLIDANMGRPGGGYIAEVISHAYAMDPADFFENIVSVVVNQKETISRVFWQQHLTQESIGTCYGVPCDSRFLDIIFSKGLESQHTLAVNKGTRIAKMGANNWAIVGTLTGSLEAVKEDLKSITLLTDKGIVKPVYAEID